MFVDKGYQEHEESNKEFNGSQKFPIYGSVLSQLFGQKDKSYMYASFKRKRTARLSTVI